MSGRGPTNPFHVGTNAGSNPLQRRGARRSAGIAGAVARVAIPVRLSLIDGDLLEQDVEVIVNAWNRNVFPWWLLLPQGISGEIKRRGGTAPFRELRDAGILALGDAVATGPGTLPFRAIIHVAGIGLLWRASERSVRLSARNAVALADRLGFRTLAMPLVGSGTGGLKAEVAERAITDALEELPYDVAVTLVRYRRRH